MLRALRVENFALIHQLQIDFTAGFNILTGETGAGKSILIDAVQAVLGSRASTDLIRTGTDAAYIEAIFDTEGELDPLFEEWGWEPEEDNVVVITRRLTRQGKSHCSVNGRTVTLSVVRQIGDFLLDIHGQHDHQSLLRAEQHSELLDLFGGEELLKEKELVAKQYRIWKDLTAALQNSLGNERERVQRLDVLRFQHEEITAAKLKKDEDIVLKEEWQILTHAEKLKSAAEHAYGVLYGGEHGRTSVIDGLETVVGRLREIIRVDKQMETVLSIAEASLYQLQEASRDVANYKENIEADPQRLQDIHIRLDIFDRLKKKYGSTVEEILAYQAQMAEELELLENSEQRAELLQTEVDQAFCVLSEHMDRLTTLRKKTAARMVSALGHELADLGMKQAVFDVAVETAAISVRGQDQVEFMFSANPGEVPKPLAKIISGGEMSRVMLALKTVLANVDRIATVIFDEIDTGIGGRAAQAVAEKMAQIALARQVLCITHLPQIACMADRHFVIRKQVESERTFTQVTPLEKEGQQEELARMLGGANVTNITLEHATEMLDMAQKQKKSWKN